MSQAKILIAEDDLFLRELYTDVLKAEGFTTESASDGQEAYDKVKQGGWDLILMDILMPKMNGLEIMQKLKNEPPLASPNKAVVFLTNLDNAEQMQEALRLGQGYLIKSQMTPDNFLEEIRKYLPQDATISTSTSGEKPNV